MSGGYDKEVDLSRSSIRWHYFKVVFDAAPEQATLDSLREDYPGEWDARRVAVNDLNKELEKLGVKIAYRRLAEV